MHLSKHDLQQMDEDWLKGLPPALLLEVSKRLLADVKTLQDRLNQNPSNSSQPPSSQAPWEKPSRDTNAAPTPEPEPEGREQVSEGKQARGESSAPDAQAPSARPDGDPRRRAGRQPGSPGHGRTQKLAVTDTCTHRPSRCAACGSPLAAHSEGQSYTATELGLRLTVTRHQWFEVRCGCGHVSRAQPWRAADDAL